MTGWERRRRRPRDEAALAAEIAAVVDARTNHPHLVPELTEGRDQFLQMHALSVARADPVTVENSHPGVLIRARLFVACLSLGAVLQVDRPENRAVTSQ